MKNIIFERTYKKSPSLLWDLGGLIIVVLVISIFICLIATKGFSTNLDFEMIQKKLGPILSLYGTIALAFEFLTALRNESNKNRLNQELILLNNHREDARNTMHAATVDKRITELNDKITQLENDLKHEMLYVRKKYYIAWFGLILITISTLIQIA